MLSCICFSVQDACASEGPDLAVRRCCFGGDKKHRRFKREKKKRKITSRSLGTVIMCCFLLSERGMKEHVNDWLLSPWPPIALGASSWQQSRVPGCHERLWLWWYCTLTSLNRIKQPHNLEDLGGTSRSNTIQFLHSKGSDAVESRRYQKPHGVATSYPQPV